jgi:hypothetical protein
MPEISPRLATRIWADFPHHADIVLERLDGLDGLVTDSLQGRERMLAAVVRLAGGRLDRLDRALELARRDWRDLLVAADLADHAWPSRLDAWLGPAPTTETASPAALGELVEADGHRWLVQRRRIDLRVVKRLIRRSDVVVVLGGSGEFRHRRIAPSERTSIWETVRRAYAGPGGVKRTVDGPDYMAYQFVDDGGTVMLYLEERH